MESLKSMLVDFMKSYNVMDFSEAHNSFKRVGEGFEESLLQKRDYLVVSSVGKGQKSAVPWICFFNEEVTKSAQKGIYVVLLIAADMKSFVVSLNQGYTYYKSQFGQKYGKEKLSIVTDSLRAEIEDMRGFSTKKIDLSAPAKNSLAGGYEAGHILGKTYRLSKLNIDEVIEDLHKVLGIYDSLIEKVGVDIDKYNTQSILNDALELNEDEKSSKLVDTEYKKVVEEGSASFNVSLGDEKDLKTPKKIKAPRRGRKTDFEKLNKNKAKIGFIGETIALDMIKNRLAGSPELLKKIEHTSVIKGDGLGYDIYYKDIGNVDKYVEVKATTEANPLSSIVITDNELEFSRENSDNYELYILYNLDLEIKKCNFLLKKGSIEENFGLRPKTYSLTKKK